MAGLAGFAASEREAAAAALARGGVVRLDRVWDPAFIAALRSGLGRSVPAAFDHTAQPPEELWRVGDRRINGLVPIAGPMAACAELLANPDMLANRRLVMDSALLRRLDPAVRKRFSRAHPVPGMQALFTLLNRSLRWHAPALHRAMRRFVRGRENPL